ncbi:MAG: class I SAM-dependent methyltransferase [Acidimicrobiales bacterium]
MSTDTASSAGLFARASLLRLRVRWFRHEMRPAGTLARWVPPSWFTDPMVDTDMVSPWERAWFTRHLARDFDGDGAVVELGTGMGASTLAILDGLRRNPTASATEVHCYDLFHDDTDTFLPRFLERLGDRRERVIVHEGDITDETWPAEAPIGFLFDDVAKTWDIWNHVKATFHRALRPGAIVVEQDFVHSCTPWIHLWHARHRDAFEPVYRVPNSGSMVFRLRDHLPQEAVEPDGFSDYTDAEIDEAFEWAVGIIGPADHGHIRGAKVHLYSLFGDLDVASRVCVEQLALTPNGELLTDAVPELARRLAARDSESQ